MIFLRKRKGSSSVLVILTFLLLMVFSVLAMSSSYADYRLASKNAQWTRDYYMLEGKAQGIISAFDDIISVNRNDDILVIRETILKSYPDAIVEINPEGLLVSMILENESGSKLLLEMELFDLDRSGFALKSLKSLPEDFQYTDVIEFEDVEVIGQ